MARRRKRIRTERVFVLGLVLFLVVSLLYFKLTEVGEYDEYLTCEQDNKSYGTVEHFESEDQDFFTSIYYPQFENEELNTKVVEMYENWLADEVALPSKDILYMDYSSNLFFEKYVSLRFDYNRLSSGGSVKESKTEIYTYNLETNEIVQLGELLRNNYSSIFYEKGIESFSSTFTRFNLEEEGFTYYNSELEGFEFAYKDYKDFLAISSKYVDSYAPDEEVEVEEEIAVDSSLKHIALTFDGGPGDEYSIKIMKLLKKYNCSATFFVYGQYVEEYEDEILELYQGGMEIGSMGYDSTKFTSMTEDELRDTILKTQNLIYSITGKDPVVIRPPGASTNSDIKTIINEYDVESVIWNLDDFDWQTSDSQVIADRILNNLSDGIIIRMTDDAEDVYGALKIILPKLEELGYQSISVSELKGY